MPKTKHPEDSKSPQVIEVKKACWSHVIIESPNSTILSPTKKDMKKNRKKSVSFNDHSLEEVIEFEDDLESKNAREKYWEFMAVDRFRFKDRIQRLEPLLTPILSAAHRSGIYNRQMLSMISPPTPAALIPVSSSPLPASACHKIIVEMEIELETIIETVVNKFVVSSNLHDAGNSITAA